MLRWKKCRNGRPKTLGSFSKCSIAMKSKPRALEGTSG
jgi:hypothetical protein